MKSDIEKSFELMRQALLALSKLSKKDQEQVFSRLSSQMLAVVGKTVTSPTKGGYMTKQNDTSDVEKEREASRQRILEIIQELHTEVRQEIAALSVPDKKESPKDTKNKRW